jgi:vacuolar iron transporter family protein
VEEAVPVKHPEAVDRFRQHVLAEWDAAALYRGLAGLSRGRRREVLAELAAIEDKHADFWLDKIREYGAEPPTFGDFAPSRRTLVMLDKARRYSPDLVLPVVEQDERNAIDGYSDEPEAPASMIAEEAEHARALDELMRLGHEGSGDDGSADDEGPFSEPWHRSDKSGALRAGIFGINDGLVSNTSLVMGFAGAAAPRATVLLAGLAGLLAGAFSMGAGEYISMANQREAYERELSFEREEIEFHPEDEQRELQLIYEAKGVDADTAAAMAVQVMSDRDVALDTMAREELGLDPDDLGSPWKAAASSFVAFAAGAVLVVLPYLVTGGAAALVAAVVLALLALVAVGAGMARLNGRPVARSVVRQVTVGVLAAGATYLLGALFGIALE